jgi:hypothetical protein
MQTELGNVIRFTVNNGGISMTIGQPALALTVAYGVTLTTVGTAYYRGTTVEMATKKAELLALGTTAVIDWANTTDGEIYRWSATKGDWI